MHLAMHPPMHPSPPPPLTDQEGAINMLILLHSQKWLPKQVNIAEPASRHYGPKISPKNNLCPTHSLKKKMARASALAPQAMYGYMGISLEHPFTIALHPRY